MPGRRVDKVQSRFQNHGIVNRPEEIKGLPDYHPAMMEYRTLFPSTVVSAVHAPRLMTSGLNQKKLGDRVAVGPWKGMPIYALTLEERETCPKECRLLSTCYGNNMPLARRIAFDKALVPALDIELAELQRKHRRGFVVRLHVLGDFKTVAYVRAWEGWLDAFSALHVFGYTAHPVTSRVGREVHRLSRSRWDRFAIRHSVGPQTRLSEAQATTIATMPVGPRAADGIVCPVLTEKKANCGSCGLCWAPAARDKRIVFVLHGRANTRRHKPNAAGVSRVKQVYDIAVDAAERGIVMPTNKEIAAKVGYEQMARASQALANLRSRGKISIEAFQMSRIITITETGKKTATPKNVAPHWRTR